MPAMSEIATRVPLYGREERNDWRDDQADKSMIENVSTILLRHLFSAEAALTQC